MAHPVSPVSWYKQADLSGYQYPTIIKAQLCKQTDTDWKPGSVSSVITSCPLCLQLLLPQLCSSEFCHYSVAKVFLFILPSHLSMLRDFALGGGKKRKSCFPCDCYRARWRDNVCKEQEVLTGFACKSGWWSAVDVGFRVCELSHLYSWWDCASVSGSKDGTHMALVSQIRLWAAVFAEGNAAFQHYYLWN